MVWALPVVGSPAKIVAVTRARLRRIWRGETVLPMAEIPNHCCNGASIALKPIASSGSQEEEAGLLR